jgi:hypothetical protein
MRRRSRFEICDIPAWKQCLIPAEKKIWRGWTPVNEAVKYILSVNFFWLRNLLDSHIAIDEKEIH